MTPLPSVLEWLKFAISAATLVSIVIAFRSYRANVAKQNEDRIRDSDKELLAQAQKSIQWAYDALTDEGKGLPPLPDRLNWLTSARHLIRAQKLAAKIASPTYKTVYEEIEEFWRHRFYVALSHSDLRSWAYFADSAKSNYPERIQPTSAVVIVAFSSWKEGVPDPTDEVDLDTIIKRGALENTSAGRGLESYLQQLEAARNKLQERRKAEMANRPIKGELDTP
ncbi:hypothetical protein JI752_018645 [Lysobacter sp. MMG2]|uniref:hypothetical protein n=1 Tax=Lysobacter sp. MMG2 TaxID=2801338 RepID=UPI001C2170E6|nr:hypothetical protein [Lysobacter sp. MMG2]MBU8978171.1 hypothetical protein [Lysobacter sp. MMG2]